MTDHDPIEEALATHFSGTVHRPELDRTDSFADFTGSGRCEPNCEGCALEERIRTGDAALEALAVLRAERDALNAEADGLRAQLYTDERIYERMREAEATVVSLREALRALNELPPGHVSVRAAKLLSAALASSEEGDDA